MGPNEIKEAMRTHLRARSPDALIIDELGINKGSIIVDVALLSKEMFVGYEIKSAADSVKRLPAQVEMYSKVFDRCAVVIDPKHLAKAEPLLPSWWGIILIEDDKFFLLRELKPNPSLHMRTLIKLVWRDEAWLMLKSLGMGAQMRTARKHQLHSALLKMVPHEQLRVMIHELLINRQDWLIDDGRRKKGR